ncbi:hypothetical protein RUESEDTHA_02885 [Ruegeria sp. THAF57]|uniref:pentapeptide repeat-containing protein n=1 Tax=Ruegeria sp. THAF57 TaxID=2744555 RepID=UPI0015DE035F|nr:pentapeptide repeat-containing protein [Ruegeria sp. THAF57]CAD0185982.1 hypothetical protein RUESEDTHA_02885 [Ruegeria sp. THAF57]
MGTKRPPQTTKCSNCGQLTDIASGTCSSCGAPLSANWSGFQGRTLWDVLNLLIVPFVLAVGGFLLNDISVKRQNEIQQQETLRQRERDESRLQTNALQAYFDAIGELQLEQSLGKVWVRPAVLAIARTKTQTIMREINRERQGLVVQFLKDANLIVHRQPATVVPFYQSNDCSPQSTTKADNRAFLSLEDTKLIGVSLANADLQAVELTEVDMREADLRNANLSSAILVNSDLRGANLSSANLIGAEMTGAYLVNTQLRGAGLTGAILRCSFLRGANLEAADLRRANFRGSSMEGANFWAADIRNADLSETFLRNADFKAAFLDGADFNWADLQGALLDDSYLIGTSFLGTDLSGADLTNASFIEEIHDPEHAQKEKTLKKNFEVAKKTLRNAILCDTIMPDGSLESRDCDPESGLEPGVPMTMQPIEDVERIVGTYFVEGYFDGYFDNATNTYVEEQCCYNGILSIQAEEDLKNYARLHWTIISDDENQQRAEGVGQITDTGELYFIFSLGDFKGDGLTSAAETDMLSARFRFLFNGGFGGETWGLLEARE